MRVTALIKTDAEMCDNCTVKPNCITCFENLLRGPCARKFDEVDVQIIGIGDMFTGLLKQSDAAPGDSLQECHNDYGGGR